MPSFEPISYLVASTDMPVFELEKGHFGLFWALLTTLDPLVGSIWQVLAYPEFDPSQGQIWGTTGGKSPLRDEKSPLGDDFIIVVKQGIKAIFLKIAIFGQK